MKKLLRAAAKPEPAAFPAAARVRSGLPHSAEKSSKANDQLNV